METWLNVTRPADAFLRMSSGHNLPAGQGIARVLKLPDGVSLELMRKALMRVVQENESLRVRIENRAGIWQQLVDERDDKAEAFFPLSTACHVGAAYQEFPRDIAGWLENCQLANFEIETGKVFISSAYQTQAGETWCYLSVHPAIADTHTIDALWGRIAVLVRHELAGSQEVYVKRLGIADLLEAQRKTAGPRFAHTEYWLANPKADLRDDDSPEQILSQPDTSIAGRRDDGPGISSAASFELSLEIKDLLMQAATSYGGTWEQAQLASIGSFIARKAGAQRSNIGYSFSNLLLFEESAAWSDAASQILCRSEIILPISIPGFGMGLEHMKQVKVQLDRIEDYSLVSQQDITETTRRNKARDFGAIIEVKEQNPDIILGDVAVPLYVLSNGVTEDVRITVQGLTDMKSPISYQILSNPNLYSPQEIADLINELLAWQYQWALAVLNKQPVDTI